MTKLEEARRKHEEAIRSLKDGEDRSMIDKEFSEALRSISEQITEVPYKEPPVNIERDIPTKLPIPEDYMTETKNPNVKATTAVWLGAIISLLITILEVIQPLIANGTFEWKSAMLAVSAAAFAWLTKKVFGGDNAK